MTNGKSLVVFVVSDLELTDEDYYVGLWRAVRRETISRRAWLDALADRFRDYEGELRYPNGKTFELPLVDDVFGDDPDLRWISQFLAADESLEYPSRRSKKLERLRLLDLYFRLGAVMFGPSDIRYTHDR